MSASSLAQTDVALLEAVADRIYPPGDDPDTDPGAAGLGAAVYITRALEDPYRRHTATYQAGLTALDQQSKKQHGQPFVDLAPDAQDALLTQMESGAWPGSKAFFALVRQHVLEGVFGDPKHGGNRDGLAWKAMGYPGVQLAYDPADLQVIRPKGKD